MKKNKTKKQPKIENEEALRVAQAASNLEVDKRTIVIKP